MFLPVLAVIKSDLCRKPPKFAYGGEVFKSVKSYNMYVVKE
jgi:hypothetical protein